MQKTSSTPQIFDRSLLRRRRRRARHSLTKGTFLIDRAIDDVAHRLNGINRSFARAVLSPWSGGYISQSLARLTEGRDPIGQELLAGIDEARELLKALATDDSKHVLHCGDDENIAIRPESLDLFVSILTLHHVNDLPGALSQILATLKPDGLFMGALFAGDTLFELRQVLRQAELECEEGMSPRIAPFADIRSVGDLLHRVGFKLPVVDSDRFTVSYADPSRLFEDLRAQGQTNTLTERHKKPLKRKTLSRALELYRELFPDGEGGVTATFEIVHAAGWAHHESQQKPLQPGSGQVSLKSALEDIGKDR